MKAQVSVEGMLTMAIVLAIFAILIFITLSAQGMSINLQNFLEKRLHCIKISNELQSIYVLGHGSESVIKSERILRITNNTLYVQELIFNVSIKSVMFP